MVSLNRKTIAICCKWHTHTLNELESMTNKFMIEMLVSSGMRSTVSIICLSFFWSFAHISRMDFQNWISHVEHFVFDCSNFDKISRILYVVEIFNRTCSTGLIFSTTKIRQNLLENSNNLKFNSTNWLLKKANVCKRQMNLPYNNNQTNRR